MQISLRQHTMFQHCPIERYRMGQALEPHRLSPLSIYVFRAIYRIGTRDLSGITRVVERKALDLQLDHLYRRPVWIDQLTGIDR